VNAISAALRIDRQAKLQVILGLGQKFQGGPWPNWTTLCLRHCSKSSLESHFNKIRFLYLFTFQQFFYFLTALLESHSCLLYLTGEKSRMEDGYIWMIIFH
jgi:hypothetical protein